MGAGILVLAGAGQDEVGGDVPLASGVVVGAPSPLPTRDATGVRPEPSDTATESTATRDVEVRDATLRAAPEVRPPVRVVVEGLVDAEVVPVGVDPDGSMELPGSGDVAGWYRYGAAPGDDRGSVVLASHVDTGDGVGQFAALTGAHEGDRVTLRASDGTRHGYRVRTVERFAKTTAPLDRWFDRDGEPRLVLVTCGGRWRPEVGSYEDNLVVVAVPDAPAGSAR